MIGSFISTMRLLIHHNSCRVFWWNIKSPRWLSPLTAQIWHPVTSGFSQNQNHLWKGRDFRPSMRLRKIQWGSCWRLGELCEVPRCLLWRGLRHQLSYVHCFLYLVFSSLNVSTFHITWLDTLWTDLVHVEVED